MVKFIPKFQLCCSILWHWVTKYWVWYLLKLFVFFWIAFSALTLLVGRQEGHPACKKTEWWGAGVVICLEQGADLHMAQQMPLPLTVSCFIKIQIGFTFLVPAYPGSPGQRAVKRVCVCVCLFLKQQSTHIIYWWQWNLLLSTIYLQQVD